MHNRQFQFSPHRNSDCRLREITWRGRRCVTLENAFIRVLICADKGSDILEFTHKPSDTEMLWQAPQGLTWPGSSTTYYDQGGAFRDMFCGGWFVMMPNGPEPCEYKGASFGHHGEATLLGWDYSIIDDHPCRVEVLFHTRLRRMPIALERRMALNSDASVLTLVETVRNESNQELEVFWGHHPCFGEPFLSTECQILLDGHSLGPMKPGINDFRTSESLSTGTFSILNPVRNVGFSLTWDIQLFPVLGIWRIWDGGDDYPNFSSRRILALEPAVDFPSLSQASARKRALRLAPGQSLSTCLTASAFFLGAYALHNPSGNS